MQCVNFHEPQAPRGWAKARAGGAMGEEPGDSQEPSARTIDNEA